MLTTNKVNISRDIIKYKAGYISNNNINSFHNIFKKFIFLDKKSINQMSNNAIKCFNSNFNLKSNKNSLFALIKSDFSEKNKKNY